MPKSANQVLYDAYFNRMDDCNRMTACVGEPTTLAHVTSDYPTGKRVASASMVPVTDYTQAAGSPDGRQCTVAPKTGIVATASGTNNVDHVAIDDGTSIIFVTTCTSQPVTGGQSVNFPSWKVTIRAPA